MKFNLTDFVVTSLDCVVKNNSYACSVALLCIGVINKHASTLTLCVKATILLC